jgi:hypothetical protein
VERKHLQSYLNEFVFRHNRRFWPFIAFHRVLAIGINTGPLTYRCLYDADEFGKVHTCIRLMKILGANHKMWGVVVATG